MSRHYIAKNGATRIIDGRVQVKCIKHEAYGTRWVPRTWLVWWRWRKEKVPKGYDLHHKDRDKQHDVMSNLKLLTKQEHSKLHNERGENGAATWTAASRRKASKRAKQHMKEGRIGTASWTLESHRKVSESKKGNKYALGNTNTLGLRHKLRAKKLISASSKARWNDPIYKRRVGNAVSRKNQETRIDEYFSNPQRKTQSIEVFTGGAR